MAHPTWDMGPVVTINSATLVNKGLELIEAHLLFGVPYADIDVVVHPQSIVHSMVTFADGATIAQASPPDMRLPIALALAWPDRLPTSSRPWTGRRRAPGSSCRWTRWRSRPSGWPGGGARPGGSSPRCSTRPTRRRSPPSWRVACRSGASSDLVARTLDDAPDLGAPTCVEDVLAAEKWAREHARGVIAGG